MHQLDIAVGASHATVGVEELGLELGPNFRDPGTHRQRDLDVLGVLPAACVGVPAHDGRVIINDEVSCVDVPADFDKAVIVGRAQHAIDPRVPGRS